VKIKIEVDIPPEEVKELMTPDYMNPAVSELLTQFQKTWWEEAAKMFQLPKNN
jgi:hypothetical protein